MNRIFKVLWNAATGTFIVTSETAKSRGKKSGRRKLAVSALVGLSSIMVSADALANAGNDTGSINQNTTDIATNTTSINNLSNSVTTLTDDAL
ncbi:ESPR domain-containing protein, partial [Salmonella enterica]